MNIMKHKEWMKLTHGGRMVRRSGKIVAVDKALQAYHQGQSPAALQNLQAALSGWMQSKGAAWKTSVRNKNNAVDTLYKQLTGLGTGQSRNPLELSRIRDESRAIITDLFQGRQLQYRAVLLTKLAGNGTFTKLGTQATVAGAGWNARTVAGDKGGGASRAASTSSGVAGKTNMTGFGSDDFDVDFDAPTRARR